MFAFGREADIEAAQLKRPCTLDGIRALRAALKILLRRCGLRVIGIEPGPFN
jgi:hypothetical protein